MGLETATYIGDLDPAQPGASDNVGQGDDHLRLLKQVLRNTFPNLTTAFNQATQKDSAYSLSAGANNQLYFSSASATTTVSFNLPPSASITNGWSCAFRTTGTGVQLINRVGTDTINGAASFQIPKKNKGIVTYLGSGLFIADIYPSQESSSAVFTSSLEVANGASFSGTIVASSQIKANGGQIVFPAAQNASANANTLDDYEEGTFTPTITCASPTDLGLSYTTNTGSYVKIGRLVFFSLYIATSSFTHNTSSGQVRVTGLPFTVREIITGNSVTTNVAWLNSGAAAGAMIPRTVIGTAYADLIYTIWPGAGSSTDNPVSLPTNHTSGVNSNIGYSGCYLTD